MKFSSEALQNLLYCWNIISKGIYFLNSKKTYGKFRSIYLAEKFHQAQISYFRIVGRIL